MRLTNRSYFWKEEAVNILSGILPSLSPIGYPHTETNAKIKSGIIC